MGNNFKFKGIVKDCRDFSQDGQKWEKVAPILLFSGFCQVHDDHVGNVITNGENMRNILTTFHFQVIAKFTKVV